MIARSHRFVFALLLATVGSHTWAGAEDAADYRKDIAPILKEFCFDCHGDGAVSYTHLTLPTKRIV